MANDSDARTKADKASRLRRPDGTETTRVAIYLPTELANELRLACAHRSWSKSELIEVAVRRLLEAWARRKAKGRSSKSTER